jgi:type IX secretion system substrate protein
MKTIFTSLVTFLFLLGSLNSQTTYKISANETWGNNGNSSYPNPCFNCTFSLADNVTLTIEKDVTFSDVKFEGGNIVVNKKNLMLWTAGGKNYFNNTKLAFNGDGQFTGNGPVALNSSTFTFSGKSNFISNHSLEMVSSRITFKEQSFFLGQGTTVSLANSYMVAGDGLLSSTASIQMNGAKLILQDKTSGIQAVNSNNYYFNWSNYTVAGSGSTINTTNSKVNCGPSGTNACSAPIVYGPIAITSGGLASTIILPVVIADFAATSTAKGANLTWSTKQESSSSYFSIERSIDGINWSVIGQVKAAGNSSVIVKYAFSDYNTTSSVSHYRLKMVDLDNRFVYSDVKSIRFTAAIATVKIFPNPASDYANITLDAKAGNSVILLINQNGQVVNQKLAAANSGVITLPLQNFENGIYAINIRDDKGANQTIRLIVQHAK